MHQCLQPPWQKVEAVIFRMHIDCTMFLAAHLGNTTIKNKREFLAHHGPWLMSSAIKKKQWGTQAIYPPSTISCSPQKC